MLVGALFEIALEAYKDFITNNNNNNKILCINALKPLCRILKASILYYQKFARDVPEIGCELNPCNPSAATK